MPPALWLMLGTTDRLVLVLEGIAQACSEDPCQSVDSPYHGFLWLYKLMIRENANEKHAIANAKMMPALPGQ